MSLNGFQLKLIAAALMVLDHVQYYLPGNPLWFRYLGRLAAPVFFYLTVEGFFHTSSVPRFIARLTAGGLFMALGSRLAMHLAPWFLTLPNIFLSLATGVAMLWAIEWGQANSRILEGSLLAALFAGLSLLTEASVYGVVMMLCFYFFRNDRYSLGMAYIALSLIPSLSAITNPRMLLYDFQWMMVFALPLLYSYNGQRGPNTPLAKWFFYVFYPTHLWALYIIGHRMSGT